MMYLNIQSVANLVSATIVTLGLLGIGHSAFAQSPKLASCIYNPTDLQSSSVKTLASCKQLKISQLKSLTTFTDISGVHGEKEIQQLAELGVLETTSSEFQPLAPITRGEFVAWLIKTYNELHRDPIRIRLARGAKLAFPDVPDSHRYFTFIQAAHNAGYLAGFEDGNFRPDETLTREQMIVLKTSLDANVAPSARSPDSLRTFIGRTKGFSDADQISEKYLLHIAFDLGNGASNFNFARVYGKTRIFAPKEPVTRSEAVIVLSRFRRGGTVERALQRRSR
ncbi:MAG: S-layer homology domain-containing protein [Trichormus sp. ATA11-4-KO1]|nr:S-layer homology domain-containing protein [Trichormus sp. ATA11-4-KO1]